jgi:hypothetical protein
MITDDRDLQTIRHPRTRRARFFAFSGLDGPWTIVCGVIGLAVALLLDHGSQFGLAIVAAAIVWAWTMTVPKRSAVGSHKFKLNDRRYQWPIFMVKEAVHAIQKGVVWIASAKEVEQLEAQQVDESTTIGLPYHQGKGTYSMVFKADGSHFSSLSRAELYLEIIKISQMITKATATAGIGGLNIGMGVRNRPQDQWLLPEMMLEVGDINAILPEALLTGKSEKEYTLEDKQNMFLYKLQQQFPQVTVQSYDVDMVIVVTVKQNSVLKRSSNNQKMTVKEMKRLPIMRIRDIVLPLLERQIGDVTILDLEGAERYLRKARDVTTLYEYYESAHSSIAHARRKEMGLEDAAVDESRVETYDRYLPNSHIIVSKDHLHIDGTYIGVIDLTTFPADEVYAHEMPFLYDAISRWSSMSVIGRTVSSNGEYTVSNTASSVMSDVFDAVGRLRSGPRAERKEAEQTDRLTEMDRSGFNQDYVVRFATLATSEDDLEEELALDFDRLLGQGLGPERVMGYSQQLAKALTTTTLIDCE